MTFSVLAGLVPIVTGFSLPYPGAAVILGRSLNDSAADFTIT